jgi:dehydrogenase/reductase SDR family protein 12
VLVVFGYPPGGMYLKKLNLKDLFEVGRYDKVATYANVKRAQVELIQYLSKLKPERNIFTMHPGWVETPGLTGALPLFSSLFGIIFRTPAQGADTINWLIATQQDLVSGELYFDRAVVSRHMKRDTVSPESDIQKLYDKVCSITEDLIG